MSNSRRAATSRESNDPAAYLVSRLYDEILQEGCVVFVGAGSTTERRYPSDQTFYDDMKIKANYPKDGTPPSFPELMQYFCDTVDGGHHNRLIREAINRIERFCVRGEENRIAMIFVESLAEVPYLNRFVTTNWDPFLERSLDVLVPIVQDRDLAFWDDRKRQVLKIHGCITRPYTIVATQSDYDACMNQNPLIFNKLKDLMATKTFLFVGYSMRDADFQEVWNGITTNLGHFSKLAYAVDRGATPEAIALWKGRGVELVKVSDVSVIRSLRKRLEKDDLIPSEDLLESLRRSQRRVVSIHINMGQETHGKLASAMYQDGLLHALDNVVTSVALGIKKKEDFERELTEAEQHLKQMKRKRNPIEIAYWSGRLAILKRFCQRSKAPIFPYFHPYRSRPTKKLIRGASFEQRPPRDLRPLRKSTGAT
jgi:hypothetical protein